ncbi:hypothetical protein ACLKA6_015665 [Drosophila palustris]
MLAKYTALTVCLLARFILTSQTKLDCTKRLDYNTVTNCCARPNFNFDVFRRSCGRFMQEGTPKMSTCLYECIFNTGKVLNGKQINVDNAEKMMQGLLGNNKDFVDVYVRSLQNCTENADKLMKRTRRRTFGKEKCSNVPLFLGMCTVENVFVHCPSASWRNSRLCEEAQDFVLNCKCDDNRSVCIQL